MQQIHNVSKTLPGELGRFAGDIASALTDMFSDAVANEAVDAIDNHMDGDEKDGGDLGF